jgi:hypothetical protein
LPWAALLACSVPAGALAAASPALPWHCEASATAQGGGSLTIELTLTLKAGRVVGLASQVTENYAAVSGNPLSFWASELDTSDLAATEKAVWTEQGVTTQLRLEEREVEATSAVRIVRQGKHAFVVHFDTISSYHGPAHFPAHVTIRAGEASCIVGGL